MTAATAVALLLLLSLAVYGAAGGTDFGAGIWDLAAGFRQERAARPRSLIDHAMAPVFEANNVWLVFAAAICWTGFPILWQSVFASLFPVLLVGVLALLLRTAFFAFRKAASTFAGRRLAGRVFGLASVVTPLCFGAALGSVASGRVGVGAPAVPVWEACVNPSSIAFGVLAVVASAFAGATFLAGDARRYRAPDLVEYFRRRAVLAGGATLVTAGAALVVMAFDARAVFTGLAWGAGLPFGVLAIGATALAALLLGAGRFVLNRVLAVVALGSFVVAWGVAQVPFLLPHRLTIAAAAGAGGTLTALLVITLVAIAITGPSLGLLYWLDQANDLEPLEDRELIDARGEC